MTANQSIHIIVITTPERLEQEWIQRLASEPTITRLDRVGVVQAGLDLVRQSQPALVVVDRDLEQTEACVRQIFSTMPDTVCIAITPKHDVASFRRLVAVGVRDVLLHNGLAYPPDSVRDKLKATGLIETGSCTNEPDISFVDQVTQCEAVVLVLLCDRYHETQVRFGQLLQCNQVATSYALRQLNFLFTRDQINFSNLG